MYDHFCYDVQVRYALGYRDLSVGHFEPRTTYNFRRRVTQHMQETGENLIEQGYYSAIVILSDRRERRIPFLVKENPERHMS